jgi:hypothetical protein
VLSLQISFKKSPSYPDSVWFLPYWWHWNKSTVMKVDLPGPGSSSGAFGSLTSLLGS